MTGIDTLKKIFYGLVVLKKNMTYCIELTEQKL